MKDASLHAGASPLQRLIRWARLALVRERRRRARSCVRCGKPAVGLCAACRGRVCGECSVLSIETGQPVALCIGCSQGSRRRAYPTAVRLAPWLLFRRGAGVLLAIVVTVMALALERDGWPGAWRVLAAILHPALLLGAVPLALILGAAVSLARRLVVSWLDRP